MLPRWRRVYSLCATIVVLLVYLKTSIGATTEITITDVSSDGSTFVTTVAATITLEPTTSLPTSFAPGPNMVVNLTRAASNSTTVTAQWDRPSGEVSGYRVQCSEGTADKSEIKDVDDTEASCTGDDIAGVEVNVTVIAFSDDKESVPDTVSIRANPNPVENLTESGADTSSVTANWMEPSGLVDGYNFTCSEGSESAVTEMDGDQYEASCNDIDAGDNITVYVSSVSDNVESIVRSILITAYPNGVMLTESGATTENVTVTWTAPIGFFNSYEGDCSEGSLSENLTSSSTTATCTGVTAGNVVTVTVVTVSGDKKSSNYTNVTALPNAVLNLTQKDATNSSVTVSWLDPGDIIDSYSVECSNGTSDGKLPNTSTEATCTGVTAGVLVTVTVYTVSGEKRNSANTNVRALPYRVKNLIEVDATTDTISASWQFPGGVVSKYEIFCFNGTAKPSEVYENSSDVYVSTCQDLPTPGDTYTMQVTSFSDTIPGAADTVQITAVPDSPDLQGLPSTVEIVSANWSHPDGIVDTFEVMCEPDNISRPVNRSIDAGGTTPFVAECQVDVPGALYNLSVISVSGNKTSSISVEPLRALSFELLVVENYSADAVMLKWYISGRCQDVGCEFMVIYEADGINDFEIKDGGNTTTEEIIVITDLIPGECYTFTGVESYEAGNFSRSIQQCTLPEAVKEFTVEDVTTDMVDLQWEMKDQCLNVGSCIWTSFNVSREPNFVQQSIDEDERSTSFTKLTPGEKYTFSIIVLSGEEQSSPVNVSERTIPESVDEFNVSLYSTDFVELYWTIKAMCYNSSCVWDSYNLTYTSDRNSEEQSIPPLDQNTETANVTGLIPGENYNFSIIGVSAEKGSSPVSFVQRTIPETVDKFEVVSYGTETVNLRWTTKAMCEGSQCVWDLYRISYVSFSGTVGKPLEEPMNSSSIKITDLTPGESYDFSITVYSGAEESEDKMVTQRTSPEAVETFKVVDYTDNAVNLSWTMTQKCEGGDCEWTSYEIHYNSTVKDDISDQERTATIDFLTPGEEYTFHIVVISDKESSTFTNTTQRLKPDNVGELSVPENSSHQITVEWDKPGGLVTSYNTTIVGPDNYFEYQNVTTLYVTYTGLTPGEYYDVTVCTVSFEESCIQESVERNIRTVPVAPSAPVNVSLTEQSITSVQLTFLPPNEPNGIISKYLISYTGRKSGDDTEHTDRKDIEANQPDDKLYTETFEGLRAGFTYVFSVTAENEAGPGAPAKDEITLNQMKPDESPLSPNEVAVPVSTNINSFIVYFSELTFSHCNGELTILYVIVVEVGGDEELGDSLRSYSEAQNQKRLSAYVAIVMEYPFEPSYSSCESRRKKRQTPSPVQIEIGDGTCSEDEKYCNGPLHGNREYKVKFRACNDANCTDTVYSDPIKTDLNNLSWVLPLVFILLILICAAALFIVWKERQQPGSMTKYIKRPTKGIDNRGFEHDKPMRRQGDRRPVKLVEFGNFLEDMSRDSDYLFSEEYNDLRPVGKNQSTDAAQLEVNRVKNRFSNILPYDHTRVTLSPIDDEEGTDYINANYMLGYRSQREYIACQGPLQSTEEDMWRLVWEQGASIIVMVTQLMENGKIKCHQYWPDEGEGPVRYGDIVVNPGETEKKELWTIRKFQITKGPHTRKITHFNFIAWPDHGVPEKPDDLIKFVRTVREYKPNDGKPTIVHCSAGVGRTGTFISLDHLMSAMEDKDEVDIFGMVRSMRMNRCMMVQTESQYIFIHQCVMALIEGSSEDDAVYENVNGGTKGYFNEALI